MRVREKGPSWLLRGMAETRIELTVDKGVDGQPVIERMEWSIGGEGGERGKYRCRPWRGRDEEDARAMAALDHAGYTDDTAAALILRTAVMSVARWRYLDDGPFKVGPGEQTAHWRFVCKAAARA